MSIQMYPPWNIRALACGLYKSLLERWPQSCYETHEAKLRLATHRKIKEPDQLVQGDEQDIAEFDIFLSVHSESMITQPMWQESKIYIDQK